MQRVNLSHLNCLLTSPVCHDSTGYHNFAEAYVYEKNKAPITLDHTIIHPGPKSKFFDGGLLEPNLATKLREGNFNVRAFGPQITKDHDSSLYTHGLIQNMDFLDNETVDRFLISHLLNEDYRPVYDGTRREFLDASLAEMRRTIKPNGEVHILDSSTRNPELMDAIQRSEFECDVLFDKFGRFLSLSPKTK